jgi:hypothetical protein
MSRVLRALLGAVVGFVLAAAVGAWRVHASATSVDSVDPSQKARLLAQGISEAMNSAAVLILGGLIVGAIVGAMTPFRRPPGPPEGGV